MDADQPLGCLPSHRIGDEGAHVATLGDVARVAEAVHQFCPGVRGAAGVPAELGGLTGEAVAGQGRQHEVEGVLGTSAVGGRVGERADGLEQLDDRPWPAVGHDQRHGVLVLGAQLDEVDVHPASISVVNWAKALSFSSQLRQSMSLSRIPASSCIVAQLHAL